MAALLFACPTLAQDTVSGYRLPPGPSSSPSTPAVQGPTDPDHPVARASGPETNPETAPPPPPRATPTPRITLPPASSTPDRQRPPERRQRPPANPAAPSSQPAPAADASPDQVAPTSVAPTQQPPDAASLPPLSAPESPATAGFSWPLILAGLAGLLASVAGLWFWRRRRQDSSPPQWPADDDTAEALPVSAPAALAPRGLALATPLDTPPATPDPASASGPIGFELEPQSLRLSFVYATLTYRLALINRSNDTFTEVRISGDLTSGHASQPVGQLLSPESERLPERHRIPAWIANEILSFEGTIQLPLADVLPLRAGQAMLLAPLARFRVAARRADGGHHASAHVFSIGLPGATRSGSMQPFRLDHGPQLFRPIEQREVEIGRWLQLDATGQAG